MAEPIKTTILYDTFTTNGVDNFADHIPDINPTGQMWNGAYGVNIQAGGVDSGGMNGVAAFEQASGYGMGELYYSFESYITGGMFFKVVLNECNFYRTDYGTYMDFRFIDDWSSEDSLSLHYTIPETGYGQYYLSFGALEISYYGEQENAPLQSGDVLEGVIHPFADGTRQVEVYKNGVLLMAGDSRWNHPGNDSQQIDLTVGYFDFNSLSWDSFEFGTWADPSAGPTTIYDALVIEEVDQPLPANTLWAFEYYNGNPEEINFRANAWANINFADFDTAAGGNGLQSAFDNIGGYNALAWDKTNNIIYTVVITNIWWDEAPNYFFSWQRATSAAAPTIWAGTPIMHQQLPYTNRYENQDVVIPTVLSLARDEGDNGLFNILKEEDSSGEWYTPDGCLFAFEGMLGNPVDESFTASNYQNLCWAYWSYATNWTPNTIVARRGFLWETSTNTMMSFELLGYGSHMVPGGYMAYQRSTNTPIPVSTTTLHLVSEKPFVPFTSETDTVTFNEAYMLLLKLKLAMTLAPSYGIPISQDIKDLYVQQEATVKAFNSKYAPSYISTPGTAQNIITDAIRMVAVPAAAKQNMMGELANNLDTLNNVISKLAVGGLLIGATTEEQFDLQAGVANYSIGVNSLTNPTDFNTTTPIDILSAYTTDTNNLVYPLNIVERGTFDSQADKYIAKGLPFMLYFNQGQSQQEQKKGAISIYPTPYHAYKLHLVSAKTLTKFEALNSIVTFNDEYMELLVTELAIRLSVNYGAIVSADLRDMNEKNEEIIRRSTFRMPTKMKAGGGSFNILTGYPQ